MFQEGVWSDSSSRLDDQDDDLVVVASTGEYLELPIKGVTRRGLVVRVSAGKGAGQEDQLRCWNLGRLNNKVDAVVGVKGRWLSLSKEWNVPKDTLNRVDSQRNGWKAEMVGGKGKTEGR